MVSLELVKKLINVDFMISKEIYASINLLYTKMIVLTMMVSISNVCWILKITVLITMKPNLVMDYLYLNVLIILTVEAVICSLKPVTK